MFTTPAITTERCGDEPDGRDHTSASPAAGPVTVRTSAALLREAQRDALRLCEMRRRAKASTNHRPPKAYRRRKCATVINITAQRNVARSVRESLASSDTTLGELLSAQKNALTGSRHAERTTEDSCLVFRPRDNDRGESPAATSGRSRFPCKEVAAEYANSCCAVVFAACWQ
jgi:hypothetical protein